MCASILVIDDKAANRERLCTVLTHAGHTVEEAVNGVDGLRRVHATVFDLIITDMVMPTMNGYQFMKELRADPDPRIATIPALFCTAIFPYPGAVELAHASGAQGVISLAAEPSMIAQAAKETIAGETSLVSPRPLTSSERLEALIADLEARAPTK